MPDSHTWKGYARQDGRVGIRNRLLVIYTVECASHVAREIALRARHPDVECVGFSGCTDNQYAIRLLLSLIRHPNVGGVLCVGLGCEYTQPAYLADAAKAAGKEADWFFIQQKGGTAASISAGNDILKAMLQKLERVPVKDMRFDDLVIGCECGGSDYTSGLAGNVVAGQLFDRLVRRNGTAIFEEIVEAVGLKDMLCARAASPAAQAELAAAYDKAMAYCKSVKQYSASPGNFAGGLTTIEEKSMGAIIKSGTEPIQGVLKVSQPPPRRGLWLLDSTPDPYYMGFGITNPNDNEGLMDLISCGCHLVYLVTGRGNVIGSAVSPVIKITGNRNTYHSMRDDMDFDASRVLHGSMSQQNMADELQALTEAIAAGQPAKAERLGHREYCVPYKYQDTPAGMPICK